MESSPRVPLEITVRFAETDMMGIVHHSAYVVWFEAGRIAWMATAGVPYAQVSAAGYNFAVTEINARYRTPIRFGEPVQVISRLTALRSRQVEFEYEVCHRDAGTLFATGHSRHICVDRDGRTVTIPQWVVEGMTAGIKRLSDE
ncbi:MAG: acyl-CoA thioesterase [Caldilineaceae bacterium]|nr:acyl-CoA thioesterase [Caldilineaceae bacterium]